MRCIFLGQSICSAVSPAASADSLRRSISQRSVSQSVDHTKSSAEGRRRRVDEHANSRERAAAAEERVQRSASRLSFEGPSPLPLPPLCSRRSADSDTTVSLLPLQLESHALHSWSIGCCCCCFQPSPPLHSLRSLRPRPLCPLPPLGHLFPPPPDSARRHVQDSLLQAAAPARLD